MNRLLTLLFISLSCVVASITLQETFCFAAGKLQEVRARGELLCGVNDSIVPFGFIDETSNDIVGFDVDICKAVADAIGVRLKLVPVTSVDRIPQLLQGAVDLVAATMTHKFDREELIDFSITYFMDGQKLLVPRKSDIRGVADLAGKKVGTVMGTTSEKNIKMAQPQCSVFAYDTMPQAFVAMKNGEVDAVTSDSLVLLGLKLVDENPGEWVITEEFFSREPYAIGVLENDSDFRDVVNKTLADLWTNGGYAKIYNKWFGPDSKYHTPLQWEMSVWP